MIGKRHYTLIDSIWEHCYSYFIELDNKFKKKNRKVTRGVRISSIKEQLTITLETRLKVRRSAN